MFHFSYATVNTYLNGAGNSVTVAEHYFLHWQMLWYYFGTSTINVMAYRGDGVIYISYSLYLYVR